MSKKMDERVNQTFTNATPDMSRGVIADCQSTTVYRQAPAKKNSFNIWKLATFALALVLMVTGIIGGVELGQTAQAATVGIDVNPSIEIKIDSKNRVKSVVANNEDAQVILGGMDLKGAKLDVAVYAIIGSMASRGILSDLTNSVLVSVDTNKQATYEEIIKAVTEKIDVTLKEFNISSSVVSQWMINKDDVARIARENNISKGKAQLVAKIMEASAKDTTEGAVVYTEAELAKTSVNELTIILSQYASQDLGSLVTNGSASDKAYVGEDKAFEIALQQAGLELTAQVERKPIGFDIENGQLIYEVKFIHNGFMHEVDVVAVDGEVLGYEMEKVGRHDDESTLPTLEDAKLIEIATNGVDNIMGKDDIVPRGHGAVKVIAFETETHRYEVEITTKGTIISKEMEAKVTNVGENLAQERIEKIALEMLARQFKIDTSLIPTNAIECELDDDGRFFEVEIEFMGMEFEFKFDAKTGEAMRYSGGGFGHGFGSGDGYHGGRD